MLDYQLAHGTTPSDWHWARVPFASADAGALDYHGADDNRYDQYCGKIEIPGIDPEELKKTQNTPCGTGDGRDGIEADKVGELGFGYLKFYELTGAENYRDAALACATALARHIRRGDDSHSPWPFRVNARTNQAREEYTADVIGPIRLFDELRALGLSSSTFQEARSAAWDWMMTYPMRNNLWAGYFEDVQIFPKPRNFNQYVPLETARYLMQHPEFDPEWHDHVAALVSWVERTLVIDVPREPAVQWGANAVSEQLEDKNKMGSHTARYASILAMWHERTGDEAAKDKAFRSFNWATYMCRADGAVLVGPVDQSIWFADGYGDYIRHFMAGLGSVPEWAPLGENHLLRSSSVVQKVAYADGSIQYRTFDPAATEVLRLHFKPARTTAGDALLRERSDLNEDGFTVQSLPGGDFIVRVRHSRSGEINISGQ